MMIHSYYSSHGVAAHEAIFTSHTTLQSGFHNSPKLALPNFYHMMGANDNTNEVSTGKDQQNF